MADIKLSQVLAAHLRTLQDIFNSFDQHFRIMLLADEMFLLCANLGKVQEHKVPFKSTELLFNMYLHPTKMKQIV